MQVKRMLRSVRLFPFLVLAAVTGGCSLGYYSDLPDATGENPRDHLDLIVRHHELREAQRAGQADKHGDYFSADNVQGIIQDEDDTLYITFFGSDGPYDLFDDTLYVLEPVPFDGISDGEKVHAAFLSHYLLIRTDVTDAVDDFLDGSGGDGTSGEKQVVSAGHSMGAATAVLCALDLTLRYPDIDISCFPSGSPKIGNKKFAETFDRLVPDCHRYVNGDDIVARLPGDSGEFVHVGEYHHIGPGPSAVRAALGLGITDHFISAYAASVEAGLY